jgi:hypothetical protein
MQTVNNQDESASCTVCNSDLTVLGSFTYLGVTINYPRQKDENCKCNKCNTEFILHYEFFDKDGHVNNFIFGGDVNDPTYNWQDQLTSDQKKEIGQHLYSCLICNERLNEEVTSDAWLASLIHNYKK